jgi:hypothetical protein
MAIFLLIYFHSVVLHNTEWKDGDGNGKISTFHLHVHHVAFRVIKVTDENNQLF